jgi:hypothetical protein
VELKMAAINVKGRRMKSSVIESQEKPPKAERSK